MTPKSLRNGTCVLRLALQRPMANVAVTLLVMPFARARSRRFNPDMIVDADRESWRADATF